jgi:ABC-type antimicrobial peptide transport system permease subunit
MLARGLIQMGVGLFLGLIGAVAANTLLSDLTLGDVSPRDPLVLMSVATIIMTVGLIACWIPAEKAARMEPSAALRID